MINMKKKSFWEDLYILLYINCLLIFTPNTSQLANMNESEDFWEDFIPISIILYASQLGNMTGFLEISLDYTQKC